MHAFADLFYRECHVSRFTTLFYQEMFTYVKQDIFVLTG